MVDVGSLLHQGANGVDGIFATLAGLHGRIGGVLVDSHSVDVGALALVDEKLVALAGDDQVPRVYGSRSTHEHRENVVGGENRGLVPVCELLDNRVQRSGNVVCGALDNVELPDRGWGTGLLVKSAVVVVEESVVVKVLSITSVEVELGQTVEINLLKKLPGILGLNRSLTSALRLVPISEAKPTSTATASTGSIAVVVLLLPASSTNALESATTSAALSLTATGSTTSTENSSTTTAESATAS